MKRHQELIDSLVEFLKNNGTDNFAKLISTSLDRAGANNGKTIHITRDKVVSKLIFWNKIALTER